MNRSGVVDRGLAPPKDVNDASGHTHKHPIRPPSHTHMHRQRTLAHLFERTCSATKPRPYCVMSRSFRPRPCRRGAQEQRRRGRGHARAGVREAGRRGRRRPCQGVLRRRHAQGPQPAGEMVSVSNKQGGRLRKPSEKKNHHRELDSAQEDLMKKVLYLLNSLCPNSYFCF